MRPAVTTIVSCLTILGAVTCAPAAPSPTATKPTEAQATAPPVAKPGSARSSPPGYLVVPSHDEIVQKARQEGELRALMSLEKETLKAVREGFTKQYPFVKFELQEISGDQAEKFVLELEAGAVRDWDSIHLTPELYPKYLPHLEKYDLLGMAEQGVLKINPRMVDPRNRNAIAFASAIAGFTYNKRSLSSEQTPRSWEEFLKPEFKGRKFIADIEPSNLASLWPLKGEQWMVDYARKLAQQEPVWARGDTRALTALAAGEYALHFASNYHSAMQVKARAPDTVEVVVPDPVPVRLGEAAGILKGAKHPHAALLLYEFMAGPEGQRILDEVELFKGSIYVPGSKLEQVVRGKQLSVMDWEHMDKRGTYTQRIVSEWGFPKAEIAR